MSLALLRLGQYLLIVAMFAACGGHWLVLQSVAWGGMIVEYSKAAGLTVAVVRTFDGQHPCGLCKVIEEGKGTEKKPDAQVIVEKLEMFFAATEALVPPVRTEWWQSSADRGSEMRPELPAVPPPRVA